MAMKTHKFYDGRSSAESLELLLCHQLFNILAGFNDLHLANSNIISPDVRVVKKCGFLF
jgi:hypothetical protein